MIWIEGLSIMVESQEMARLFAEFTPGAFGIWTGVLMFAGWWLREWRETRKLSVEDRLARRDGYAKQVQSLMVENRLLRQDLRKLEELHDKYRKACQAETDVLRTELQLTKEELDEMKDALLMAGNVHKEGHIKMMIAGGKG